MDNEFPLNVIEHVRDSSRLNARTLRRLAGDGDTHSAWLRARADEVDQFAEELDRYLTHVVQRG